MIIGNYRFDLIRAFEYDNGEEDGHKKIIFYLPRFKKVTTSLNKAFDLVWDLWLVVGYIVIRRYKPDVLKSLREKEKLEEIEEEKQQ